MSMFWQHWILTKMGDAHFGPNQSGMQWPSLIPYLTIPYSLYCYTTPLPGSHGPRQHGGIHPVLSSSAIFLYTSFQ